jgi:hypothetical protein
MAAAIDARLRVPDVIDSLQRLTRAGGDHSMMKTLASGVALCG